MGAGTIIMISLPIVLAIVGLYLNHMRLSRMFKENELIKVINSKNVDIDKINNKYDTLWNKFERMNETVRELNMAFIRLNSINFTYPFPFMLKDVKGKIIMVNDEWTRLNNISREDAIGKTDYELYTSERSEHFKTSDSIVLNSLLGFVVEKDHSDHNTIIIKWEVQGIIKEDKFIAVISVPAQTLIAQCQNKI